MEEIFSERLREILWHSHMTQQDLAKKTGLTAAAISHYVNGKQCPHAAALLLIADALNVSIDYLLGRTKYKNIIGLR